MPNDQKKAMTDRPSPIDDHWRRFRWLMVLMTVAATVTTAAALWWLDWTGVEVEPLLALMVAVGIFLTVMLAAALMGLVFLSNRAGLDEEVEDFSRHRDHHPPRF